MKTSLRTVMAVLICTLVPLCSILAQTRGPIFDSKHNLSKSGKGDIKSPTESRVCIFCHSSHNTSTEGPLWNHLTTTPGKFRTYQRATMDAKTEQPNGSTKLCLSCHDGTIAVGAIKGLARPIPMKNVGSEGQIPDGKKSNIGTNLAGTHPVSVKFSPSLALSDRHLRWPPVDPKKEVGTDADGYVQCTSCHDPHDDSKSEKYPFWKKETFDEVCVVCHMY